MNGRGKGASKRAPLDKESQQSALSVREHGAGASQARLQEDADSQLGFTMLAQGEQRTGWLLNVATVRAHSAPIAWSEPSAATIRCSLPAHLSAVLRQRRNLRPRAHRSLSFLSRSGQPTFAPLPSLLVAVYFTMVSTTCVRAGRHQVLRQRHLLPLLLHRHQGSLYLCTVGILPLNALTAPISPMRIRRTSASLKLMQFSAVASTNALLPLRSRTRKTSTSPTISLA